MSYFYLGRKLIFDITYLDYKLQRKQNVKFNLKGAFRYKRENTSIDILKNEIARKKQLNVSVFHSHL